MGVAIKSRFDMIHPKDFTENLGVTAPILLFELIGTLLAETRKQPHVEPCGRVARVGGSVAVQICAGNPR